MILTYLYRVSAYFLNLFRRLGGKNTLGVRAIVIDVDNQVLLVKHTYQPGWYLPGGGVKKCETFQEAIERELREEAGVHVQCRPQLFEIYIKKTKGVCDYPALFIIKEFIRVDNSNYEIKEIGWFSMDRLPPDTTRATKSRLEEYFYDTPRSLEW